MRGILLTYDRQLGLAELLHKCYMRLWPDSPLRFRLPFNGSATGSAHAYLSRQANCEFVACDQSIRQTMRALLEGIAEDEWVYWCIDDRYPTWLDRDGLRSVLEALGELPAEVEEVKLLRWKERVTREVFEIGGEGFHEQAGGRKWGYWHHRPVRARVLRAILLDEELSEECTINDIQRLLLERADERMRGRALVPGRDLIKLAEPLVDGQLTRNGVEDMRRMGCEMPPYGVLEREVRFRYTEPVEGSGGEGRR
jgi:hypothetical protein